MPSTKSVKQRIRSVRNTAQITKAMEVVSATKMRRSQESALRARPYAVASLELMKNLLQRTPKVPELFQPREIASRCLVVVTSDKGLAGAFNANVLRKAEVWMKEQSMPFTVITVGKKAKEYMERRAAPIEKSFLGFGDYTQPEETKSIADLIIGGFLNHTWDDVTVIYANFRTTLLQETVVTSVLPTASERIEEAIRGILPDYGRFAEEGRTMKDGQRTPSNYNFEYKFEPSVNEILHILVPQLVRIQLHHLILESNASEHSARMIAMKNASQNAKELIDDLTLSYNNMRQAGITRELTEITAGKEALEG